MGDAVPSDHLPPGQGGEINLVFTPLTRLSWVITVLLGISALLSVAVLAAAFLLPVRFRQITAGVGGRLLLRSGNQPLSPVSDLSRDMAGK